MRTKETLRAVGGSVVVYIVVAACSGAGDGAGMRGGDGGNAGDGASGLDVLTNPVPDAKADEGATSGSRLKANRYVGSDGSSQFVGTFHDTQLNVDCVFEKASDGMIRCVPFSSTPGAVAVASFFSDAGCTQPIASSPPCSGTPTTVSVSVPSTSTCGSPKTTTYGIGPVYTGAFYEGTPASCTLIPMLAGYTNYSLGAVIPPPDPTQWVAATTQTDP